MGLGESRNSRIIESRWPALHLAGRYKACRGRGREGGWTGAFDCRQDAVICSEG